MVEVAVDGARIRFERIIKALLFTFIQFLWEIFLRMFELHCEIELVEMIVTFLNLHVLISYFYFNVE